MKAVKAALLGLALAGIATAASAQNEQFIPMNGYWVGPYAPGGSGIFGGGRGGCTATAGACDRATT